MGLKCSSLLCLIALLASCAHKVDLSRFDEGTSIGRPVLGKSVAIVIDSKSIQDNHETQSDVHTYQFRNVTDGLVHALTSTMESSAKKVVVLKNEDSIKEKYDYYFHPELKIRSVNDFWTMGCFIQYRLKIKNSEKQVVADEKGTGKRNFAFTSQVQNKCELAMAEVFEKVTNKAASLIR